MKFRPLALEEQTGSGGASHRFDFYYGDIPAGIANNTSLVLDTAAELMPALPATLIMKRILIHLTTPFKNSADSAFNSTTLSVGDSGSATRFANAVQINENGTEVIDTFPGATENYIYTAASQLVVTINSMSGKSISNLNVGQFYILFWIEYAGWSRRTQVGAAL